MLFEYKIKIEAKNKEEAEKALQAMIDLKKTLSYEDLILFARKVRENPSLIQSAKRWL
jgi:hypothetical protein